MPVRVAVVAFDGISPFHLTVPCLVFGPVPDGSTDGLYDTWVASATPGRLTTTAGFDVVVDRGLDSLDAADTVVVPSHDLDRDVAPELVAAVRAAHARGARVVGLCLGAFVVAETGLLDGRAAVTHWAETDELARRHPSVTVRPAALWVDHGDVLTSAGVAASLDSCLHLVRSDHGVDVAGRLARYLVMAPHREGSQAQYLRTPVVALDDDDPVERAMVWARAHLDRPIDLDGWARVAGLSRRTFTRRFRDRTGTSCHDWLVDQRLGHVRLMLETTGHSVDRIAAESGFGTAHALRHHFRHRLHTTPARHRRAFAARPPSTG